MSRSRRILVIAAAAAGIAALILLSSRRAPGDARAARRAPIGSPSAGVPHALTTGPVPRGRTEPGVTARYQLDARWHVHADATAMGGDSHAGGILDQVEQVRGTLERRVVDGDADADHVTVWLRVADPQVTVADGAPPTMIAALERGVLIDEDQQGRVTSVRIPDDADRRGASALERIAGAAQVIWPAATARTWSADEDGPTGRVAADYQLDDDGVTLHKRIAHAIDPQLSTNARHLGIEATADGAFDAQLDPTQGRLVSLDGRAHLAVVATVKAQPIADLELRLSLRFAGERTDDAIAPEGFGARQALNEPARPDPDRDDRALARGLDWATLAAELAGVEHLAGPERAALQARLAAFLRVHPEACAGAAGELANRDARDPRSQLVLGALARAGHAEAQAAMRTIADAELARADRGANVAISMVGRVDRPSADTVAYLSAIAARTDVPSAASAADLALGAAADHLIDHDPARADAITADLAHRLDGAAGVDAVHLLDALGNAGGPAALAAARAHLADADPDVRGAAVFALRFAPAPDADALLADVIGREDDVGVLEHGLRTLALRTPAAATTDALAARAPSLPARLAELAAQLLQRGHAA